MNIWERLRLIVERWAGSRLRKRLGSRQESLTLKLLSGETDISIRCRTETIHVKVLK